MNSCIHVLCGSSFWDATASKDEGCASGPNGSARSEGYVSAAGGFALLNMTFMLVVLSGFSAFLSAYLEKFSKIYPVCCNTVGLVGIKNGRIWYGVYC